MQNTAYRILLTSALLALAGLIFIGVNKVLAQPRITETIILRSGNVDGQRDSRIKMLVGPPSSAFSRAFTEQDFINARNGMQAYLIEPNQKWLADFKDQPGADTQARWISTRSNGNVSGDSALYAIDFNVDNQDINYASLKLYFSVDDQLGGGTNTGVYINGKPTNCSVPRGGAGKQYLFECENIANRINSGLNTLYVAVTNRRGPSGLIFSATITVESVGPIAMQTPTPTPKPPLVCKGISLTPSEGAAPLNVAVEVDAEGEVGEYEFDFGESGAEGNLVTQPENKTVHTYTQPGEYEIKVKLKNNNGKVVESDSCKGIVNVNNPGEVQATDSAKELPKTGINPAVFILGLPFGLFGYYMFKNFKLKN